VEERNGRMGGKECQGRKGSKVREGEREEGEEADRREATIFQKNNCMCPPTSHIDSGTRERDQGGDRTRGPIKSKPKPKLIVGVVAPREEPPVLKESCRMTGSALNFDNFFGSIFFP
jgi:hypothetical protein